MSSYSTPRLSSVPTCVGKLRGGPLVQVAGVAVVAVAIVFQCQAEQGAGVAAVGGDGPLQQRDDFARIAAQRRNRRRALVQILGRLLDGAGQPIEHVQCFLRPAVVAQRFGLGERHLIARVAGPLGRLVGRERLGVLIERQVRLAEIEVRQRAAVAVGERFDRVAVAAEQVQANAQPGRRRRAAVRLLFELAGGLAQLAVVGIALADRGGDLHNLIRPERRGRQHNLLHNRFGSDRHIATCSSNVGQACRA